MKCSRKSTKNRGTKLFNKGKMHTDCLYSWAQFCPHIIVLNNWKVFFISGASVQLWWMTSWLLNLHSSIWLPFYFWCLSTHIQHAQSRIKGLQLSWKIQKERCVANIVSYLFMHTKIIYNLADRYDSIIYWKSSTLGNTGYVKRRLLLDQVIWVGLNLDRWVLFFCFCFFICYSTSLQKRTTDTYT